MRNMLILFSFGIACTLAFPLICNASEGFLAKMSRTYPEIRWEKSSVLTADFNGDKIMDSAALGYKNDQVIIGISMGHKKNVKVQLLPFTIGAGIQAAVCALPATLNTEPLECTAEDRPLRGCKQLAAAKGLLLSGGECDPIHLYWNHLTKQMWWWRL
jgi:hypothetical protein